jgi:hypothetical protein
VQRVIPASIALRMMSKLQRSPAISGARTAEQI